jgi:hypothetical protein
MRDRNVGDRTEIGFLENAERVCRIDTPICLAGAMSVAPGELLDGILWIRALSRKGPSPSTRGPTSTYTETYEVLASERTSPVSKERKRRLAMTARKRIPVRGASEHHEQQNPSHPITGGDRAAI